MSLINRNSNVLIATFSPWEGNTRLPINGNVEPMVDYFTKRVARTTLIDQPYPGSSFVVPRIERYIGKKLENITASGWLVKILSPFLRFRNFGGTHISFKLRDFLSVLDTALKSREVYDVYIGFEAINALAGILLRKCGRVTVVVYYVSDYSPNRYSVSWFNALYLWLDRFAAKKADVIWDVSPAMQSARIQAGLHHKESAPVIVVPNALYPHQISLAPIRQIKPWSVVFIGTLGEENGPDLAIEAMKTIIKKYPSSRLHILGGGKDIERLKNLVSSNELDGKIIFHGFIADRAKVSDMIRRMNVAVAPYRAIPGSARWYGDATKIRAYLAAGLPTVTTKVPPLGKEAADCGAALVVEDSARAIAEAVVRIFKSKKIYLAMRKAAFGFAKENTWENEYSRAFGLMEKIIKRS
jgi:glycosyltransferase involved in cell wall biosynthesis